MKKDQEPDTSSPIGHYLSAWVGYSNDESIRKHAASGGLVSALFCHLLDTGEIDAALVCNSIPTANGLDYQLTLARDRAQVLSAQSSKYFDIPMLKGIDLIKAFDGKVGVVGLPSQINAFWRRASHSEKLSSKIAFRISLFCGHNSKSQLMESIWTKHGIDSSQVKKFYFRQGHWRGQIVAQLKDGSEKRLPFQSFSHYQNLHILSLERCLNCFDHMGYYADVSTGDTWSGHMKKDPVKHSLFMSRTPKGEAALRAMIDSHSLIAKPIDRRTVYLSQKRSINYHYAIAARAKLAKRFGFNIKDRTGGSYSWRDLMGASIVLLNHRISKSPRLLRWFMRLPRFCVLCYLLVFKALMNYERKDY